MLNYGLRLRCAGSAQFELDNRKSKRNALDVDAEIWMSEKLPNVLQAQQLRRYGKVCFSAGATGGLLTICALLTMWAFGWRSGSE